MFSPLLIFYSLVAVSLFILGLVVFLKNSKIKLNQLFFAFTTAISLWLLSNYFSNDFTKPESYALVANHLALFFSGIGMVVLFRFTLVIAQNKYFLKHRYIWYLGYLMISISLTPFAIESIEKQEKVYAIIFGPLAPLYFIALAGSAVSSFAVLIRGIRRTEGEQRNKLRAIFYSLIVAVGFIMITNFLIPILTGSFAWTNLGPVATVVVVGGLAYSIVKHRLFDIKLVVARALAYLLSLGGIIGIYATIVFISSQTLFTEQSLSLPRQMFYVAMSVLAGLIAVPLKKFFDKLTNRIFYRDAYDTQTFLDQLNKVLVSSIDLEALLKACSQSILDNIRPTFSVFALAETSYSKDRIIGSAQSRFGHEDLEVIKALITDEAQAVIEVDALEDDSPLRSILSKYEIAIMARLTLDPNKKQGLGYLIMGPKKSGNPYSQQDIKVIEIIANELVIAIQNALRFEEIEKFNITLQEKVDDATRQLRKSNEKLKQLDETKDEFISMASHQLRTPLTSVKGYLSMVLEGDAGEIAPMQQKLLDQAFVSSQRMVYLIADLLNVSRLRTGKFVIDPIESNLADVVEGEIGQLKETAAGRGLELTYVKPANFPKLYLDETKIRQVIMNFTDNAIYYTLKGGHIEVRLEDKGESIELTVNDDGMGVPKSEQPHLFSKFYRAANAQKARPDGTGLGLFMAKKVVIAQGGNIIFRSTEGKGSTFGFAFPKNKLQPPAISSSPTATFE